MSSSSEEEAERAEKAGGAERSKGESAEKERGDREGTDLALDMEGLVADLRAQEGETVSRIEALRSQASALAEEEEWLATGSLGKGHAWEALSQTTYSCLWGAGTAGGADVHSLTLEADRLNLKVANRAMEEDARLAAKQADLLGAAATILDEHVSEEIEAVHAHLTSASTVALDVVGTAMASSTFTAAAAARSRSTGGSVGDTTTTAAQSQNSGPVRDLLFSTFREFLLSKSISTSPLMATPQRGESMGGVPGVQRETPLPAANANNGSDRSVSGRTAAANVSAPVVLRLTDIQPYRPPSHEDLPEFEQFYVDHISAEKYSVAVPKGDGLVTAIDMGPAPIAPFRTTVGPGAPSAGGAAETTFVPSGVAGTIASWGTFLLAAGTSKGGIAVWAMPCREEATKAGSGGGVGTKPGGSKIGKEVVNPGAAILIRVASSTGLPKDERHPVKRVRFGADGRSQLVSLDSQGIVKVWDVGAGRNAVAAADGYNARGGGGGGVKPAARDFLPDLRGVGGGVGGGGIGGIKFQALPLVARWTIRQTDLERPLLDPSTAAWLETTGTATAAGPNKTDNSKSNRKQRVMREEDGADTLASSSLRGGGRAEHEDYPDGSWPASTKRDARAMAVAFHPAMSAFGEQHSVVIGTAGGSVVKCNADAWSTAAGNDGAGRDGNTGAGIVYGRCVVPIEPGDRGAPYEATVLKSDIPGTDGGDGRGVAGGGNSVRREFFERHRHPVVFVGFQDRVSLSMVTLDESGLLCVWPYSPDAFSGFGWYTPSKEVLVDVTLHTYALEAIKIARRAGRSDGGGDGGSGGGEGGIGRPAYIFNRALPPASSETADPEEALDELRAGGSYRLWSTAPTPANGRSKTYIALPDVPSGGGGGGGGGRCRIVI
ncbi:unnamed protein product, partial [Hapterophycus canaliculatus]